MTRTAWTTAVFVMLAFVCLPLRADDASFTRELKAGVEELKKEGEELAEDDPNSSIAKDLSALFTDVGQQLLQENARLRQEDTPVYQRVPILRRLYLQQMRKIHEMKTDGASAAFYNEQMQSLKFYHYNVRSSGEYSGGGGAVSLSLKLQELLNIGQYHIEGYDSYSENLLFALKTLSSRWNDFSFANHDYLNLRRAKPKLPVDDTASRVALKLEFPAGAGSMVDAVVYELAKLDIQLGEQNLTDEERSQKLRERFLETVQRVGEIWPIVHYDEDLGWIVFLDRNIGGQRVDAAGDPMAFRYPYSLMRILGLDADVQPDSAKPSAPPPSLNFAAYLEKAIHPLVEHGRELVAEAPKSVIAYNLSNLFSEVGSQLLLRNEQMEAEKTPVDERIPILRQLYLQQMRQIHKMTPDSNSMARYNERHQTLYFHYNDPSGGGGGGGGNKFTSELESLLKIRKSINGDPYAKDLTEALWDLPWEWVDFEFSHMDKIHHIVERAIVRPNRRGLTPTQMRRSRSNRGIESLMDQIVYELTKLDVELAEREAAREERAKELRRLFFEIIREVEYIGLEVQVVGDSVKIPFRDAGGTIVDSAGAPIVFEFPPKLMAALKMPSAKQGSANRLQLLMGGAAALLLLLLAGLFFIMRRNSAKEAETES